MRLKPRSTILLLFTLITACALCFCLSPDEKKVPLSVALSCTGETEYIKCWKNNAGDYYAFLPAYAVLDQACLKAPSDANIYISGKPLDQIHSLSDYTLNTPYELQYGRHGSKSTLTFVQSDDIPSMHIDTVSGSMEYIHAKNGNEESGRLRLYSVDGKLESNETISSINGRGNYTWEMSDKKPYSICLSNDANLLGMGAAQKWILLSNAEDPSNLRNKTIYHLAGEVGLSYTPQAEWVSLYLNDEYAGLYLLCERNEVHAERVDIQSENAFLVSTGRQDRLDLKSRNYFSTESGQHLRIHFPENISMQDLSELQKRWQTIENVLLNADGKGTAAGKKLFDLIDLDSWVRKYLLEEIACNLDACYISQFYYSDGDNGPVFAGPVWDYDLSLGNPASWQTMNPQSFLANRPESENGIQTPWFYSLYRNEVFYNRMCELYQADFLPAIEKFLSADINKYIGQLENAVKADYIRWEVNTDFKDQTEILSSFIKARISFLSDAWLNGKEFCQVHMVQDFGGFSCYSAVEKGDCLSFLPQFEDADGLHFLGWYYADSNEPVDSSRPVNEDISIYGKWQEENAFPLDIIFKLIPFGTIALLFIIVFIADIRRTKNQR